MPAEPSPQTYSDAQLDGLACIYCGRGDSVMEPILDGPRGQVFRCVNDCVHGAEAITARIELLKLAGLIEVHPEDVGKPPNEQRLRQTALGELVAERLSG